MTLKKIPLLVKKNRKPQLKTKRTIPATLSDKSVKLVKPVKPAILVKPAATTERKTRKGLAKPKLVMKSRKVAKVEKEPVLLVDEPIPVEEQGINKYCTENDNGFIVFSRDHTSGSSGGNGEDGEDDLRVDDIGTDSDSISLTGEQKEKLIDDLESKKYRIKKRYKKNPTREIKDELREVCRLLANVKECDAVEKVGKNVAHKDTLSKAFKKKHKKLLLSDFNKIIDLTGRKEERKPDISTEQIWHRSKSVIFKNKTYRTAPREKEHKFKQKMTLKQMPKHMRNNLKSSMDGNLRSYHIRENRPEMIRYQKYNPYSYNGLSGY